MARDNSALKAAKKRKDDEFYSRYEDIEKELEHYVEDFRGKVIYCPCDDYRMSNFVKYFKDNYERFGLSGLIASNYDIGQGAFVYEYDGKVESIEVWHGQGGYEEHADLRDRCDLVITNPPFSKFREFMSWLEEGRKK